MTLVKPGLRAIGHVSWGPVYPVRGAAGGVEFVVDDRDGDDDPFDEGGEDDGDGDDEDDGGEVDEEEQPRARKRSKRGQDDGYTPPDREAVERMRDAIRRNNQENKRHRVMARRMAQLGIGDDIESWLAE